MAGYKRFKQADAEVFIRLYEKYMMFQVEQMKETLLNLPTDCIERVFDGKEFYSKDFDLAKLDDTQFGTSGLCGYGIIRDSSHQLNYMYEQLHQGRLVELLEKFGHKVNLKKVGFRND